MKKFFSDNWKTAMFIILLGLGVLYSWTHILENALDGVSQNEENSIKSIILSKYPNFESEAKQLIKEKNPTYLGTYGYEFTKTDSDNIVIVKYGIKGGDFLEMINPFSNTITTDISISVRVYLGSKQVELQGSQG